MVGPVCRKLNPGCVVLGEFLGTLLQWTFGGGLAKVSTESSRQDRTGQSSTRDDHGLWATGVKDHEEAFVKCRVRSNYEDCGVKWLLLIGWFIFLKKDYEDIGK